MDSAGKENNYVIFEADDLIYNRFDLIYKENVERHVYESGEQKYVIYVHHENGKAQFNIWGKLLPQPLFEHVVDDVFRRHPETRSIEIKSAKNNYDNLLNEGNDIMIFLPETVELLLDKIRAKSRYTLKRQKRLCAKEYGELETAIYHLDIPDEAVRLFFGWKQMTQGTDYHMSPEEYLRKYHVTDCILLKAGGRGIGILFFCQVNHTVYLENLSYDMELEKFSPGYLVYEELLEELVKRKCTYLYLGGGDYAYKKRFGAKETLAYSGIIYRKEVYEGLNRYFKERGIGRIAIYGLGAQGRDFLKIVSRLNVELLYGIDREEKRIEGLRVFSPSANLEKVDAVIITLKSYNREVEVLLKTMFGKVYYWRDLVAGNSGVE